MPSARGTIANPVHAEDSGGMAAIRAWNDPTASFRTDTFALLFVAAWNSIAIATLQRCGREWRELDEAGVPHLVDGRERARETGDLVAMAWPVTRHVGLRRNVEFWIGLRNHVAHRHLPALDAAVTPQARAGLLNLEGVLVDNFGDEFAGGVHPVV
jgi:hypothetical protein